MVSQAAVEIWFIVSILVGVSTNVGLLVWAIRSKRSFSFMLAGMPGYLDALYVDWCREKGRPFAGMLWLRALSLLSLVAAGVAFSRVVANAR
jgi:hypothetical protein